MSWIEGQISHNSPSKLNPGFVKVETGEAATIEQFSSSRGRFIMFKEG